MNTVNRRRPARVGKKQIIEEQDPFIAMTHKLKHSKKHMVVAAIILLFIFLQGFFIGNLSSK